MTYKGKYIGEKQIKGITKTKDKTPNGIAIMYVGYMDDTVEPISSLMIEKIVSDEPCDATQLREKRLYPIVEEVLEVLRDWGLKLNELAYLSVLINQSIEFNQTEALIELWSKYTGRLHSPDDVDMLTIDKVLKEIKPEDKSITMDNVLNNPDTK